MVRLGIFLFFVMSSFVMNNAASEQQKLRLGFTLLPGVLDDNALSPYNKLLNVVSEKTNVKLDADFSPTIRSNHFLEEGKIDCIFPISKSGYQRKIKTLFSDNFNIVSTHFFTLKSAGKQSPGLNTLQAASWKTVVYKRGYLFANMVTNTENNISFVPVENTDAALQLLKSGRADAYLEYMPDLQFRLANRGFEQLTTDFTNPIQTLEDAMECADTTNNQKVIAGFNSVLADLKASDQLRVILGNYYNME